MNERIRELGLQAAACTVDPNSAFTAEEFMSFQEKFAELIIKECAQVAFEGDLKRAIGQWGADSDILQHFSVEHDVVKKFRGTK